MGWDAYTELLVTWSSSGFHSTFDLYSSLQDAISGLNRWEFCNGGDPGIGFPRDCGVHRQTAVFYQWNSFTDPRGQQDYMYSVLDGWQTLYQHGRYGSTRLQLGTFNRVFRQAGTGILRRQCSSCHADYKDVYIKVREPMGWDAYTELLVTWSSSGFQYTFDLYSSLQDALSDNVNNRWRFCNGGDPGIGFPRDCGLRSSFPYQWNSFTNPRGQQAYMYSVLESTAMPAILLP